MIMAVRLELGWMGRYWEGVFKERYREGKGGFFNLPFLLLLPLLLLLLLQLQTSHETHKSRERKREY